MGRLTHLLVHRAVWTRATNRMVKGQGGTIPITMAAALRCRYSPTTTTTTRGIPATFGDESLAQADAAVYCEPSTALQKNDELTITDETGAALGTFRVTSIMPPSLKQHLKVLVEDLQRADALA